jgi:hypothetical protein
MAIHPALIVGIGILVTIVVAACVGIKLGKSALIKETESTNTNFDNDDLTIFGKTIELKNTARDIERVRQGGLSELQVKSIIATLTEAEHSSTPELKFVGRDPYQHRK